MSQWSWFLSEALGEESDLLPFLASEGCAFLGPWPPPLLEARHRPASFSPRDLPSSLCHLLHWACLRNPGQSPHFKIFNHICKIYFCLLGNILTGSRDQTVDIWGQKVLFCSTKYLFDNCLSPRGNEHAVTSPSRPRWPFPELERGMPIISAFPETQVGGVGLEGRLNWKHAVCSCLWFKSPLSHL